MAGKPEGWHTLTSRIFVDDVAGMVSFLKKTFKATGRLEKSRPSEISIGDSFVMVSSTVFRQPMPACLYVYVDDVDATYKRAIKQGVEVMEEPQPMPYGDRRCMVRDAWGNVWQIATYQG